ERRAGGAAALRLLPGHPAPLGRRRPAGTDAPLCRPSPGAPRALLLPDESGALDRLLPLPPRYPTRHLGASAGVIVASVIQQLVMSVPFNEASIPGRHTIRYRVRDDHKGNPVREVEVLATPEEIRTFVRDGYLVRERLIPMEQVERLRQAFDETVARDERLETKGGKRFGGVFMRHMMDKHPAFLEFLNFPPAVSVARALFGPFVQSRGFTGRVCYPDTPEQETVWHFHQRLVPDPLPPMFSRPQSLDVLIYLDDIDDRNGPLCVLPGSPHWLEEDLSVNDVEEKPGQVVLRLPAGSLVLAHGALWHRSLPTQPDCTIRRLLLWGYGPAWQKPALYGVKPKNGPTDPLLADPDHDEDTRELLGAPGFR